LMMRSDNSFLFRISNFTTQIPKRIMALRRPKQ
jgi:hypothetical protein